MQGHLIGYCVEELKKRCLPDGGFSHAAGNGYRPDATAWAIVALLASSAHNDLINPARSRLAKDQLRDGRVSVSQNHPEAFWPTPLAILAWQGSAVHREPQSRAVGFLLKTSGVHWTKKPGEPSAHDTSIRGWPWIANTHSWVEPSTLSLMALQVVGYGNHSRTIEGNRMLLDRQLPNGGWNYGNTLVFGKVLRPMPESTGMALNALAGNVSRKYVQHSLEYLKAQVKNIRSPLSLGWSILGLGAWGERPSQAETWVTECLKLQERCGEYQTSLISLMLIAVIAQDGLVTSCLRRESF